MAALASAHTNAPNLTPVLLWLGPAKTHGMIEKMDETAAASITGLWLTWLREQGVLVIDHHLSFQQLAEEAQAKGWVHSTWLQTRNTYAVIDVPSIAATLRPALDPEIYDTQHVLWTELHVFFTNDVNSCSFGETPAAGMGPEIWANGKPSNSAVMHLNIDAMALEATHVVDAAAAKRWNTLGGVQGLFLDYFGDRLVYLRESLNYKTYW